jgi:hypothetical protein
VPTSCPASSEGVEQQERDDHQRSGAHGGHAHDEPPARPDERGGPPAHLHRGDRLLRERLPTHRPPALPPHQVEVGLGDHAQGREDEDGTEGDQQSFLEPLAGADVAQQQHTAEGPGDRTHAQPSDQAQVHGAAPEVDKTADRFHEETGDDVAGHRRQRWDSEEHDEERGHQRPAAHAGQSDDDAHQQPGDRDRRITTVHRGPATGWWRALGVCGREAVRGMSCPCGRS